MFDIPLDTIWLVVIIIKFVFEGGKNERLLMFGTKDNVDVILNERLRDNGFHLMFNG